MFPMVKMVDVSSFSNKSLVDLRGSKNWIGETGGKLRSTNPGDD